MTEQLGLLGNTQTIAPTGRPLTRRQQLALDYIRSSHNGRGAAEIGALLHAHRNRNPHGVDERCLHCGTDGLAVLRSRGLRPLLIRRRSGMWQLREPDASEGSSVARPEPLRKDGSASGSPSRQLDTLPGDTWEDLFGDAA